MDIDNRIDLWIPALLSAEKGENPTCPRCGHNILDVQAKDLGENIGYVLITCEKCGKSGYFSRVDLKNYKGKVIHESALAKVI